MDDEQEILKRIGMNVKAKRKKLGLTQAALATACKLDIRNVQRVEAGEGNPTLKTL